MKIYRQSIPQRRDGKYKSPKAGNRPVELKYRTVRGEWQKMKLEGKTGARLCFCMSW